MQNKTTLDTGQDGQDQKPTNSKCWRECGGKGALLCCRGKVNWYCRYGKQHRSFLQTLKAELPYDPAIPLLGAYLETINTQKHVNPNVQCRTMYNIQDMEAT